MSVQNGERLATKQDLADMYSGILPYLGGMPEVLANKFSKGDLYSTDEKMIGQWIDGKPLYQKTIVFTPSSYKVSNNYELPSSITGLNTNCLPVAFELRNVWTQCFGTSGICSLRTSDATILISGLTLEYPNIEYQLTIKYCKSTDSATSIGEATDYSTEEKIIGTWLNGEPLWQKTISCGGLVNNAEKTVAHGISNLDKYMVVGGYAGNSSGGSRPVPFVSSNGTGIGLDVDTTNIYIDCRGYNWSGLTESYITLQYTKSNS